MNESPEVLKTFAAELVDRVKAHGATEADVLVAEGDSVSVQVRLSAVECLSQAREKASGNSGFFRETVRQCVHLGFFRIVAHSVGCRYLCPCQGGG